MCTCAGQQFLSTVTESPGAPLTSTGTEDRAGRAQPCRPGILLTSSPGLEAGFPIQAAVSSTCFCPAEWRGSAPCFWKRHMCTHAHPAFLQCRQGFRASCPLGSQGFPAAGTSVLGEEPERLMKEGVSVLHPKPDPAEKGCPRLRCSGLLLLSGPIPKEASLEIGAHSKGLHTVPRLNPCLWF